MSTLIWRGLAGLVAGLAAALVPACDDGVEQAPACEQYTACIRALDQVAPAATNLERFEPGGPCWNSDEGATLCERACIRGLEWESQRSADPPAACTIESN